MIAVGDEPCPDCFISVCLLMAFTGIWISRGVSYCGNDVIWLAEAQNC
jgi:hypothetical protein